MELLLPIAHLLGRGSCYDCHYCAACWETSHPSSKVARQKAREGPQEPPRRTQRGPDVRCVDCGDYDPCPHAWADQPLCDHCYRGRLIESYEDFARLSGSAW
jgi:hypothetical protein